MARLSTRRQFLVGGCVTLGTTVAGCTGPEDDNVAAGGPAVVTVGSEGDAGFTPQEVEVDAERTVRWEWASEGHTVTPTTVPTGAQWEGEPEPQPEGHAYEHDFEVLGPYQYECTEHPSESAGIVHVRERANP